MQQTFTTVGMRTLNCAVDSFYACMLRKALIQGTSESLNKKLGIMTLFWKRCLYIPKENETLHV